MLVTAGGGPAGLGRGCIWKSTPQELGHRRDRIKHHQSGWRALYRLPALALGLFVYQFGFASRSFARLTLALLILPVVIVATREAIRSIPVGIREGAYASRHAMAGLQDHIRRNSYAAS
jgi:hypothetical protein